MTCSMIACRRWVATVIIGSGELINTRGALRPGTAELLFSGKTGQAGVADSRQLDRVCMAKYHDLPTEAVLSILVHRA